jgi:predicted acylesterase/phospholipase RssA
LDFAPKLEEYNRYHKEKEGIRGIRTSIEQNEPRFLLVAANVQTAKPETFDSYDTNNITINHVLASAAIPINYPYMEISGLLIWHLLYRQIIFLTIKSLKEAIAYYEYNRLVGEAMAPVTSF